MFLKHVVFKDRQVEKIICKPLFFQLNFGIIGLYLILLLVKAILWQSNEIYDLQGEKVGVGHLHTF